MNHNLLQGGVRGRRGRHRRLSPAMPAHRPTKPNGSNLTTGLPADGPALKNGARKLVPKCADYEKSTQDPIMRSVSPRAKMKLTPTEPRKIARNTSNTTILKAYQSAAPERSSPNHILLNILTWLRRMNFHLQCPFSGCILEIGKLRRVTCEP